MQITSSRRAAPCLPAPVTQLVLRAPRRASAQQLKQTNNHYNSSIGIHQGSRRVTHF